MKLEERQVLQASVARALDELVEAEFITECQEHTAHKLLSMDSPTELVRAFVREAGTRGWDPDDLDAIEEIVRLAGFLVFLAGPEVSRDAVAAELNDPALETTPGLYLLGRALGLLPEDEEEVPPSESAELVKALAATLDEGEPAIWHALALFWSLPGLSDRFLVESILRQAAGHPNAGLFAFLALLLPLDAAAIACAADWLAQNGDQAVHDHLGRLKAGDVGVDGVAAIRRALLKAQNRRKRVAGRAFDLGCVPVGWPVLEVHATAPDGQGSQGLYVVRRRSARRFALVGAVVNERRGIVSDMANPDMSRAEVRDFCRGISGRLPLTAVPLGYAMGRIREGLELSRTGGFPLPFGFQIWRHLFAGLWDAAAPDVAGKTRQWEQRELRERTDLLFAEPALESWFFFEYDSPALHSFVRHVNRGRIANGRGGQRVSAHRQAVEALELAHRCVDEALGPKRAYLAGRLEQLAFLLDCQDKPERRDLAATAALDMGPDSGVPLSAQPFALTLLCRCAELGSILL